MNQQIRIGIVGAALLTAAGVGAMAPVGAQDTTTSTTSASSSTTSTTTTAAPPATIDIPTETIPTPEAPLGPVESLRLAYDPTAGTIAITNPCGVGGDHDDQQVTYDLFLIPATGTQVQLAEKQSPYATVTAYQTATYTIPDSLPHGSVQVLLQCSALPITIGQERQQFATTIDWQGRGGTSRPGAARPAAPVSGDPSFTG